MPHFGLSGELIFHGVQGASTFAFRIHEDGTGLQEFSPHQVSQVTGLSPDGQWVVGDEGTTVTSAYPMGGGDPIRILGGMCTLRWQSDGKILYFSIFTGMQSAGAYGRTYAIPLPSGKMLPNIPKGGFRSEDEIASLPGARLIDGAPPDFAPGPTPDIYAFSRLSVQRNLYRIPLP